jgi:hypothetical protein
VPEPNNSPISQPTPPILPAPPTGPEPQPTPAVVKIPVPEGQTNLLDPAVIAEEQKRGEELNRGEESH